MKPAPIPSPLWTSLPDAAKLLAECLANPPETRVVKVTDLSTYYEKRYVGPLVRELNRIHRAEANRLFSEAQDSRNYDAFDAHCRLTVQNAIQDALIAHNIAKSAAHDEAALAVLAA